MNRQYEVLEAVERTRVNDVNEIERYFQVKIRTAGGVVRSVNVDEADFTPERVKPILDDAAQKADEILKL